MLHHKQGNQRYNLATPWVAPTAMRGERCHLVDVSRMVVGVACDKRQTGFTSCAAHTDNRPNKIDRVATSTPADCRCHPRGCRCHRADGNCALRSLPKAARPLRSALGGPLAGWLRRERRVGDAIQQIMAYVSLNFAMHSHATKASDTPGRFLAKYQTATSGVIRNRPAKKFATRQIASGNSPIACLRGVTTNGTGLYAKRLSGRNFPENDAWRWCHTDKKRRGFYTSA